MDIKSAENQVSNLLEYLQDIEKRQPILYKKSKDRMRDIASNCIQVVKVISNILQDETLMADDVEFSGSRRKDIYNMIESMENELAKMKEFAGYESTSSKLPSVRRIDPEHRINTLVMYEKVLHSTALSAIPYSEVHNCAKLVWMWYDARFSHSSELHPNFRYNIRRLREWLVGIVILYGKYHEDGKSFEYVQMFRDWIGNIDGPDGDRYAVPYEVYSFCKDPDISKMTLSSIVIWDVLKDYGYRELFIYDGELVPKEDDIYNMYVDKNPTILDTYRSYQFDSSIISECKLGGSDSNEI